MYSKRLIAQVKTLYPESIGLLEMAEDGEYILGSYLKQYSQEGIDPDAILRTKDISEAHEIALKNKLRKDLYALWIKETEAERTPVSRIK